jgi:hypothetical protein
MIPQLVQMLGPLGLAAALAQAVAWTYVFTFRGMSYSRAFVQGIPLAAVVACMLMLSIGDSLAAGVGIAGGLSVVRFRTTLRDPRDMVFVFAGLAAGIATGRGALLPAAAGIATFCGLAMLFHALAYGTRTADDAVVRFVAPSGQQAAIAEVLVRHAPDHALVTLRQGSGEGRWEHAYQVRVGAPEQHLALVDALEAVAGVEQVRLYLHEPTQEL